VISILVVDDLEVIRRQIGIILGAQHDLNVVAEASNAFEAIRNRASDCHKKVFAKRNFVSKSIASPTHDPPAADPRVGREPSIR